MMETIVNEPAPRILTLNGPAQEQPHAFRRLLEGLPVQPLLNAIALRPELWTQIEARQQAPGSPHHDTQCIFLRWCHEQTVCAAFNELEAEDYPAGLTLSSWVVPVLRPLWDVLGKPEVGRVLLVSLQPGGTVDPHIDEGRYADRFDRFHICLQADQSAGFAVDGREFRPEPGEAWWFNHKRPHTAWNFGDRPRIHLIVDMPVPECRAQRGLTYQREAIPDWTEEAMPMFEEHRQEISHYQDIPLNVDLEWYRSADQQDRLRSYTARINGVLVGYCVLFIQHNRRYMTSLQAVQDVLFVTKAHRHGRVGLGLIRHAEAALRRDGVQTVYQHVKANRTEGRLFARLGYDLVDHVYAKRLDQPEGT